MNTDVKYNGFEGTCNLCVIKGGGPSLLGKDWLKKIRMDWASIRSVQENDLSLTSLLANYSEIFSTSHGVMTKHTTHLTIKPNSVAKFHHPRSIPFTIKDRIGKELDRLEAAGVLRRIEHVSDMGSTNCPGTEARWRDQNLRGL